MHSPRLSELEGRLVQAPAPGGFRSSELDGLPEPVRRHLTQAIAPGTALATSAWLRMRGHIKVGRWLPFRARQVLNPHRGFVWSARAAGVIAGSDRYVDDAGVMNWKLAGLVRVVHAEGPDISRSAAGRAGAEAVCLPTALLPRFGVRWSATGDDQVTARYQVGRRRWRSTTGSTPTGASAPWCSTAGATPTAAAASPGIPSAVRSPATAPSRG
jgi:hypothetical protein